MAVFLATEKVGLGEFHGRQLAGTNAVAQFADREIEHFVADRHQSSLLAAELPEVGKFEDRSRHVCVLQRKGAKSRQRLLPLHDQPAEVLLLFLIQSLAVGLNDPLIFQLTLGLQLRRERARRRCSLVGDGVGFGAASCDRSELGKTTAVVAAKAARRANSRRESLLSGDVSGVSSGDSSGIGILPPRLLIGAAGSAKA